jgi:hypothetical protein
VANEAEEKLLAAKEGGEALSYNFTAIFQQLYHSHQQFPAISSNFSLALRGKG